VVTDGAGVSGTADVGAQTLVRSAKASAGLTTTLKGRLLTVAVKAKGAEAPRGKKLVTVSVGKKVLMADLKAHGKAKVKLPKVEKGTKIKIKFVGTSAVASATKVIKAK
jgi:hypothetical protein